MNNNNNNNTEDTNNVGFQLATLTKLVQQVITSQEIMNSNISDLNVRVASLEELKSGRNTPTKVIVDEEKNIVFTDTHNDDESIIDLKTPAALKKLKELDMSNTTLNNIQMEAFDSAVNAESEEHINYISDEDDIEAAVYELPNTIIKKDMSTKRKPNCKIISGDKRRSALFKEMGNIESSVEFSKVSYVRPIPDITHLHLKSTDPEELITFYTGILEVTLESNVQVRVQTRIDKKIRDLICAKFDLVLGEYYNLNLEEVMVCLSKMVSPDSQVKFVSLMKKCLKINISYNKFKYEDYYFALLRYIQDFDLLFKILAEDNLRVIPAVNDKTNGLIKLFGYHIDKKFFDDTRLLLGGNDKKYKTIYEFISEFKRIIMEYYDLYSKYKILPDHRESSYKKYGNSRDMNKTNQVHEQPINIKTQRLQNISAYTGESFDYNSEDSEYSDDSPWVQNTENMMDTDVSCIDEECEITQKQPQDGDELNYLGESNKPNAKPISTNIKSLPPCNWMATNGKCNLVDDPRHTQKYSHDKAVIREKQLQIMANIKASLMEGSSSKDNNSKTILQRPRGSK